MHFIQYQHQRGRGMTFRYSYSLFAWGREHCCPHSSLGGLVGGTRERTKKEARRQARLRRAGEWRPTPHPSANPDRTMALGVDQLVPAHPDVLWHSAALNAGWFSPSKYYWVSESWGHTSSDASGGGPCWHTTCWGGGGDRKGRMPQKGQPAKGWRKNSNWRAADTTDKCRNRVPSVKCVEG